MEAILAQMSWQAGLLLLAVWELLRFLGGKGWNWLHGVAAGSVSKDDCGDRHERIKRELRAGDDLFLLLLEGQALQTEAILAMCQPELPGCKEIVKALKEHNRALITHRERRPQ